MNQQTKEHYRYQGETSLITALALLRAGNTEDALEYAITAVGNIGAAVNSGSIERVVGRLATSIKKVRDSDHDQKLQDAERPRKPHARKSGSRAPKRSVSPGQEGHEPTM